MAKLNARGCFSLVLLFKDRDDQFGPTRVFRAVRSDFKVLRRITFYHDGRGERGHATGYAILGKLKVPTLDGVARYVRIMQRKGWTVKDADPSLSPALIRCPLQSDA